MPKTNPNPKDLFPEAPRGDGSHPRPGAADARLHVWSPGEPGEIGEKTLVIYG